MNRSLLSIALAAGLASGAPLVAEAGQFQFKAYVKGLTTPAAFQVLNGPATAQTFPAATVGSYAASDVLLSFKNAGGRSGSLTAPAISGANPGDFSVSNTCLEVAPSAVCSVTVKFKPTATGVRTASLAANGATYTLSGVGNASFGGAWAAGTSGSMGTLQTNTSTSKRFQLAKTGGSGTMSVGFVMAGDTSQFQFTAVGTSLSGGWTCALGGAIAADKSSISYCYARDQSGALANIEFDIRYAPTVVGDHSVTVTPITNNGTALPEPLAVTGSSRFNPTGVWATGTSGSMGTIANLTTVAKRFQLTSKGAYGVMAVGFVMTGDTSQFQFTAIGTSLSGGWTCASGGAISADKSSVSYCYAREEVGALANIEFDIRYAPTAVGDHSVTVTPITSNGTTLPAPLVVTGGSR